MNGPPEEGSRRRRAASSLAFGAFLVSFSPVFVKAIGQDAMGPTAIGFYRVALGALILAAVGAVRRERLAPSRRTLAFAALAGFAFALDLFTWHKSILGVGAGMSTILANTQVIWVSLFGVLVLREGGGTRLWGAIGLAVTGIVLMSGVLAPAGVPVADPAGFAFGLATGVCYASYLIVLRRARSRPDIPGPAAFMAWICAFCALFLLALCALEGASVPVPDGRTLVFLLALAVVVQGMGWVTLSTWLPHAASAVGALILLLQPTLSTLWGSIFFGERLHPMEWGGALLVLVAIYLGATLENPGSRAETPAEAG